MNTQKLKKQFKAKEDRSKLRLIKSLIVKPIKMILRVLPKDPKSSQKVSPKMPL